MLFFLIFVLIISIAFLIRKQYSYWETTKIPHVETKFPFGAITPVIQRKHIFGLELANIYQKSQEKIVGLYIFFKPYLLVRDAQLSRQILTSDFGSFHDRGLYVDEKHDPLSANLFSLPGQNWRTLRAKLTPSFTSGKLKGMFETIDDVGNNLVKYLNSELKNSPNGKIFEMKDIMTNYSVDVIGSVIFGLDVDSFKNPDNEFRTMHTNIVIPTDILERLFSIFSFLCPPLAVLMTRLGYRLPWLKKMCKIMERTIKMREEHKIIRKDLLQLLLQLRNTGKISDDNDTVWSVETAAEKFKSMSIEMIAANSALFFIAGTETTAATASFTIYELSMYPVLLRRAQDEVREVLEKHGLKPDGRCTYEALQDMKFLELCIMETTRKYPGLPFLNRECTEDFEVPDTKYTIKKGTPILISLIAMQRDPEYFPDPLNYNPERFLDESKNYDPAAYMPFGEGPRHCIAQRMGKMNAKLAVVKVLANFDITPKEHKEVEFEFTEGVALLVKGGKQVHLSKRI